MALTPSEVEDAQGLIAEHSANLALIKRGKRDQTTIHTEPYETDDQLIEYLEHRILYWTTYVLSDGEIR